MININQQVLIELLGFLMGHIMAMILAWDRHRSVIWAIIFGFFGWIYVIVYLILDNFFPAYFEKTRIKK
jgi:hypothetical protein